MVEANLTTLWLGTMLYAIFLLLAVSSSFFIMHRQVYLVPRRPGSKTLSVLQSPMIMGVLLLLLGNTAVSSLSADTDKMSSEALSC